ncbi:MAG: FAD-dependent oxidoreductase [Clostridia bacterium]|nr:FAD-dependent oxidoreductase [Clostridia bacterium]
MKTVIIGGVAAGASCAARLRRLDESARIVLLERGPYISYANCGLPYHIGGVIKSRDALLVTKTETMENRFNVEVRTESEAVRIDRGNKTVMIRNNETGEEYSESYDKLVIATGSSPVRPPIPGIDDPRITTLWTVPDTDKIRDMINARGGAKSAVVIGGGFIGIETAENLHHAGLDVTLVEAMDQVMAPFDPEMAKLLHENIAENGVALHLGDGVDSFRSGDGSGGDSITVRLKSGRELQADLVILSIGVRPNSQLAKEAGLALNERGGIITDDHLRTADPDIYAAGDVIEVTDIVSGGRTMVPLAGPANKMGRIVADNIAGGDETYHGTQGSSVAKVFDLTAASTGSNEKTLKKQGLQKGIDYETLIITQNHHAGYYPGAVPMILKMIFASDGSRIFGAQIVGTDGVDKRIDTIGVALRMGADIEDLKSLELAYAPPYSSAKDPVNMAGFTAENIIRGMVRFCDWDTPDTDKDTVLLDIREEAERMAYEIPGAVNIPLDQLRGRLDELDPSKSYITFCAIGVRSYNAARILMQNGFGDVSVYPGGVRFYASTHAEPEAFAKASEAVGSNTAAADAFIKGADMKNVKEISLDCCGMQCPGPIMEVYKNIENMEDGDILKVAASDPGFSKDIVSWCRRTGNTLISNEKEGVEYVACIQKGAGQCGPLDGGAPAEGSKVVDTPQGKTIIVFDGDMDKVLASFIIANGALAMGRPVTMFFTFWGLTALRKSQKLPIKKNFMEKMFGMMLPRGPQNLKLSKMNMCGMGTAMMKGIMKDKNIDSLEDLMKKAMDAGVKIIACSMSMDVMGIREEELIDGVEIGGVGTYLGAAEESNVNLFI